MRSVVAVAVCLSVLAGSALADDQLKPEELRKMYDDTLVQLKAAQDRKAVLAQENQKLAATVADLQKQLKESQSQLDSLQRDLQTFNDAAEYWRHHYLAWIAFLDLDPAVQAQWNFYLDSSLPEPMSWQWYDPAWPFSAIVNAI